MARNLENIQLMRAYSEMNSSQQPMAIPPFVHSIQLEQT